MKKEKQKIEIVTGIIGLLIIALGFSVLIGWLFDIQTLKRILPQFSAMNPTTATSFILLSVAFLLSRKNWKKRESIMTALVRLIVIVVLIFSSLRIIDIFFGNFFNLDFIFFQDKLTAAMEAPARMALATAVCFFSLSTTLFFISFKGLRFWILAQVGLLATFLIAGMALFFYFWKDVIFLENPFYFSMALHTTVAFLLLALITLVCLKHVYQTKIHLYSFKLIIFLCFAMVPTWYFLVVPEVTKLPEDFSYSAKLISTDNLFDKNSNDYSGEIVSNTDFSYQVESTKGRIREIKNSFQMFTPLGDDIFSVERIYGIDEYTTKHVTGFGDHDREGYLFAPKHLNKEDFVYWHVNYDVPISMKFQEEDNILGLKVYRYVADFQADQTNELSNLAGVGTELGINLDINLNLWIEPSTGRLIKYEDQSIAYYYSLETGERIHPWNKFSNRFTANSVEEQAEVARKDIQQQFIVEKVIPIVLIVIALGVLLVGLIFKYQRRAFVYSLPFLIFILSLSGSFALWRYTKNSVDFQASTKFEREIDLMTDLILERMEIYANALRSGRGLFLSSDEVSRNEWKDFVGGIDIQKNYPGVQGLGFAQVLKPNEINIFEEEIRAEGFLNFKVFPDDPREIYTSIKFLEPFDFRNQRAFGYDMFSQETRRTAMEYARDNDRVSISGKVLLLQETEEDIQPGFLMYVPLYQKNYPIENVEERRKNIAGYIYSPFRMRDFMRATFLSHPYQIKLEIFDGNSTEEGNELYESKEIVSGNKKIRFEEERAMSLYGHTWTLKFSSLPDYGLGDFQEAYPSLVLRLGLIFSVFLTLVTYSLSSSRARALKLAGEITKDLQIKTKDLEEKKQTNEAILAGIGEGLMATDELGNIILANDAFSTLLGWKKEEVINRKMLEVIPMKDESGKTINAKDRPLSKVLNSGEKIVDSNKYYTKKDGKDIPIELNVTPLILQGKVFGAIEVFRDVSKEKEVDRMKTEFLSLASHQLRTPLSAIKWFLEIILTSNEEKISSKQREMLEKVEKSNQRMIELVNSLLNVSRLEQGRIMVEPEATNLKKLLEEVIMELSFNLKKKEQKLEKKLDDKVEIKIDPKLIRQVLLNLMSNAIKYSPSKSKISISLIRNKKDVVFSVKDEGYGIPEEEQKNIFTKFYRASNISTKDTEGNGLGLYLVKQIVEVSGGRIWFESKENEGTTFSFSLPLSGSKKREGVKTLT